MIFRSLNKFIVLASLVEEQEKRKMPKWQYLFTNAAPSVRAKGLDKKCTRICRHAFDIMSRSRRGAFDIISWPAASRGRSRRGASAGTGSARSAPRRLGDIGVLAHAHTGVCEQIISPEKKNPWKIGLQNTKSGAGEQFLLWACRARAPLKGVFSFTDDDLISKFVLSGKTTLEGVGPGRVSTPSSPGSRSWQRPASPRARANRIQYVLLHDMI